MPTPSPANNVFIIYIKKTSNYFNSTTIPSRQTFFLVTVFADRSTGYVQGIQGNPSGDANHTYARSLNSTTEHKKTHSEKHTSKNKTSKNIFSFMRGRRALVPLLLHKKEWIAKTPPQLAHKLQLLTRLPSPSKTLNLCYLPHGWAFLHKSRRSNMSTQSGNDDPRLGQFIGRGEAGKLVIVGFPSDEGVKRNSGRPGAKGVLSSALHFIANQSPIYKILLLFRWAKRHKKASSKSGPYHQSRIFH